MLICDGCWHRFIAATDAGEVAIADDVIRIAEDNPGVLSVPATLTLLYREMGQLEKTRTAYEGVLDGCRTYPSRPPGRGRSPRPLICAGVERSATDLSGQSAPSG